MLEMAKTFVFIYFENEHSEIASKISQYLISRGIKTYFNRLLVISRNIGRVSLQTSLYTKIPTHRDSVTLVVLDRHTMNSNYLLSYSYQAYKNGSSVWARDFFNFR